MEGIFFPIDFIPPEGIRILCPKPHYPELPQLSKKTRLYLSCWRPPLPVSIKDQPEITCLSGGVCGGGDEAAVAGCTLAVVGPGRVEGWTGTPGCLLPQRPAEVPLLWDKKEAAHFPRKALDHDGQGLARGWPHSLRNIWNHHSQKTRAEGLGLGEKSLPP